MPVNWGLIPDEPVQQRDGTWAVYRESPNDDALPAAIFGRRADAVEYQRTGRLPWDGAR